MLKKHWYEFVLLRAIGSYMEPLICNNKLGSFEVLLWGSFAVSQEHAASRLVLGKLNNIVDLESDDLFLKAFANIVDGKHHLLHILCNINLLIQCFCRSFCAFAVWFKTLRRQSSKHK